MTGGGEEAAFVFRGETVESVHRAQLAVVRRDGALIAHIGDPRRVIFTRSAAKPFQAVPLLETGGADALGITPSELAVVCGSHAGESGHIDAVRSILQKAGADASALDCGRHPPTDPRAASETGAAYSSLHNNCSGKHAGMLALARHLGVPGRGYLDRAHPVQQRILAAVAEHLEVPVDKIAIAIDGCSAPNFAVPLDRLAHAYAKLGYRESGALRRIRDAMTSHPEMVGGRESFDTIAMRAFGASAVFKVGAEGVQAVACADLGIVIKIEDGSTRARPAVTLAVLEELGIVPKDPAPIARFRNPVLRNHAGHTVGRIEATVSLRLHPS